MIEKTLEPIFKGGYFVLNESVEKKQIPLYSDLVITHEDNLLLKGLILTLISNARYVIKICSFILSDDEIAKALIKKCQNSNVAVFILTQLDPRKFNLRFVPEEENSEKLKRDHLDYLAELYSLGAHVRAFGSAHAKFLLSDQSVGLIMSANLTTHSLNKNPESGIVVSDKGVVNEFEKLFDLIFQKGTEYVSFKITGSSKQLITSRKPNFDTSLFSIINTSYAKFTWNNQHNSLYHEILKIINSASEDIYISTYSIVGLENLPEFTAAIKSANAKGLEVKIFCRAMNHRNDHLESCQLLTELGVEIYGDFLNHSKGIFSGDKGFLFTANIDGYHGLVNDGFEVGAILTQAQLLNFKNFVFWQIETAPFVFKNQVKKKKFAEMYEFFRRYKGILDPILPTNFKILQPEGMEINIKDYPIYLLLDGNSNITKMRIRDNFYDVNMMPDYLEVVRKKRGRPQEGMTEIFWPCDNLELL